MKLRAQGVAISSRTIRRADDARRAAAGAPPRQPTPRAAKASPGPQQAPAPAKVEAPRKPERPKGVAQPPGERKPRPKPKTTAQILTPTARALKAPTAPVLPPKAVAEGRELAAAALARLPLAAQDVVIAASPAYAEHVRRIGRALAAFPDARASVARELAAS